MKVLVYLWYYWQWRQCKCGTITKTTTCVGLSWLLGIINYVENESVSTIQFWTDSWFLHFFPKLFQFFLSLHNCCVMSSVAFGSSQWSGALNTTALKTCSCSGVHFSSVFKFPKSWDAPAAQMAECVHHNFLNQWTWVCFQRNPSAHHSLSLICFPVRLHNTI